MGKDKRKISDSRIHSSLAPKPHKLLLARLVRAQLQSLAKGSIPALGNRESSVTNLEWKQLKSYTRSDGAYKHNFMLGDIIGQENNLLYWLTDFHDTLAL